MAFCQEIGLLAERENHHPEICIAYDRVKVELNTHSVDGLTINDFILAAKIDAFWFLFLKLQHIDNRKKHRHRTGRMILSFQGHKNYFVGSHSQVLEVGIQVL